MITKIVIKSESGYCCVDDAYKYTLTIMAESIAYLYNPYLESETNPARKWRYTTTSPVFRTLWEQLTETIRCALSHDGEPWVTDIGDTTFIITYDDGTKVKKEYGLPSDTFQDTFRIVKKMVPGCETVPVAISVSEDYEGTTN